MTGAGLTNMDEARATGSSPSVRDYAVVFSDVTKEFTAAGRTRPAICDIDLVAQGGRITSFIGPSGCGKSTLLNLVSGIAAPTKGTVSVNGVVIDSVKTARQQGVGFVTQDANLLPWRTVYENISLPLRVAGVSRAERKDRTMTWIDRVGLGGFEEYFPSQLSGGMQKRCSVARTLVYAPKIVLLDEPFGALDALTRLTLQDLLVKLLDGVGETTAILVTHDLQEAIAISDQVAVITGRPGRMRTIVDIPLPHPRDVYTATEAAGFADLHARLRELILEQT
jgi:NitT/TauT family transport system ATP-binding protein